MKYKVMGNFPDQDHIRSWLQIGECNTKEEFSNIVRSCMNKLKDQPGSTYLRMQQPGCFKIEENDNE